MKLGTTSWLTGGDFLADARLVAGRVDFVELLVYTWDREMQARVAASLDALAGLDLEYTLHLPTDNAAGALAAARFFVASGFPLLNMTLHPLPGWRQLDWPELV
ncbi:MAG: xylose isomerase, partial [Desulfobulbaceae bacterium]|nr:xylose isomerase [Desulfobulbaceae bacterium]